MKCPNSFFFGGGAWGSCYHIGIYKAILNEWGHEIYNKKFAGNSAGALISLGICLKKTPEEIEEIYACMATNAIKKYGLNNSSCHDAILKKWLITGNEYKELNNKLFVGITVFFNKYKLVSNWKNNQELINTLHGSMHIPLYCSNINLVQGNIVIDGGFSNIYMKLDETTLAITLQQNYGEIYPSKKLSIKEFILPNKNETLKTIIENAYNDFELYKLKCNNKSDKIRQDKPLNTWKNKYILLTAWSLRFSESIAYNYKIIIFILTIILLRNKFLKNIKYIININ